MAGSGQGVVGRSDKDKKMILPAPKRIGVQGICSESRESTQFYLISSNIFNFIEGRVKFTNSSASD